MFIPIVGCLNERTVKGSRCCYTQFPNRKESSLSEQSQMIDFITYTKGKEGCAFIILNEKYGGQYLAKKKPNDYGTGIPLYEVEALARVLLPEIQKFFESEEGQREFKEWKNKQQDREK